MLSLSDGKDKLRGAVHRAVLIVLLVLFCLLLVLWKLFQLLVISLRCEFGDVERIHGGLVGSRGPGDQRFAD